MGDVVSKRNITRVGQWEMLLVSKRYFPTLYFVFHTQKFFMLLNEAHLNLVQIPQVGELF